MRKAPLIAAGFILAAAGQAFAASQPAAGTSNMPSTDAPMQSTTQTAPPSSSPSTSAPSTGSATGSASDTAATAGSATATPAALCRPTWMSISPADSTRFPFPILRLAASDFYPAPLRV